MKLSRKHLIALAIAFIFILIGVIEAVTGKQLNKKIMDEVSLILIMGVAFVLFGGRNKKTGDKQQKPEDAAKSIEEHHDENQEEGKDEEVPKD